MKERRLYVDASGNVSRVALTEDGQLMEFMIDAPEEERLVGNIYRGRVENVLQGMQAAFVNIGRERNAFLFVSDMPVDRRDFETDIPVAERLTVKVGQEIMCQVIKDEVGTKGARVTTNLSFVGRYLVGTPTLGFYGISRKISDPAIRAALGKTLQSVLPDGWGGIARTQSAGAAKREIKHEAEALDFIYGEVLRAYESARIGDLLYSDGDLVYRTARDVVDDRVASVTINDAAMAGKFEKYLKLIGLNKIKVERYPAGADLFGDYGLTGQVNQLLSGRVTLESGGSIVIDRTEALTAIDVNSGKYVGTTDLEETVFRVNVEAAAEIARQIRLRNIGGIIVVDFIDMDREEHRREVLRVLEEALDRDRIKTRVVGMTPLGLVEITRKKTRKDVSRVLQEPCPYCAGTGLVVAASTVVPKVAKLLNKSFTDSSVTGALVTVHPAVGNAMKKGALTRECETLWKGKRIYVVSSETFNREAVRIVSLRGIVYELPDGAELLY